MAAFVIHTFSHYFDILQSKIFIFWKWHYDLQVSSQFLGRKLSWSFLSLCPACPPTVPITLYVCFSLFLLMQLFIFYLSSFNLLLYFWFCCPYFSVCLFLPISINAVLRSSAFSTFHLLYFWSVCFISLLLDVFCLFITHSSAHFPL